MNYCLMHLKGSSEMKGGVARTSPAALSPSELGQLRQATYRLFGALFLYPDEDRLAKLRTAARELRLEGDLWGGFAFSGPMQGLLAVLVELSGGATTHVEEEYVRLFQVKPAAPPYESVYMDPEGQTRGLIAVRLEGEYAQAGLVLSPSLMDLPDHIAVEFEFMSFLCGQEALAGETKAREDSIPARERQRAFLGHHLGRWFPQFARRVREASPESPYDVVVEAAHAFLYHDLELLQLRHKGGIKAHTVDAPTGCPV